MKPLRIVAAAALAAGLSCGAAASRYSDLWFDPAESGWGMNIVQQDEHAFVTLFVYGPDGRPVWYVASDATVVAYSSPGAYPVFRGSLYRTEGPWHGGPFDADRVRAQRVGELELEALGLDRIRLHYVADGVAAVKELRRQTFASALRSGVYAARFSLRVSRGEPPPAVRRYAAEVSIELEESQGYMRAQEASGAVCEYRGPYAQAGKMVRFSGAFTCTAGEVLEGTFAIEDLELSANGFTGYLRTSSGMLAQYGPVAGARY